MENKPRKSLFGGYPHEGVKSREVFKGRCNPKMSNGKRIGFEINREVYPNCPETRGDDFTDFLLDRIEDYHQALEIAERQIDDISHEYPFIPEDFGFELTNLVPDNNPDEYLAPFYKKGQNLITRIEDHTWLYNGKDGSCKINLPNAHIAFLVLRSLGIISDEEFEGDTEFVVNENDLTEEDKAKIETENQKQNEQ